LNGSVTGVQTVSSTEWSQVEIIKARAICRDILRRIKADVTLLEPVKSGKCGDPAPVKLHSIGAKNPVTFVPAPTMNCSMIVALDQWLREGLQPAAKKYLKSRVTQVSVMSDYSCRSVYGRSGAGLSQHARANALDIAGFAMADNRQTLILSHWGPTGRDIRRYIAQRDKQRQQGEPRAAPEPAVAAGPPVPAAGQNTVAEGPSDVSPVRGSLFPSLGRDGSSSHAPETSLSPATSFSMVPPSRLGGPKADDTDANDASALFRTVDRARRTFLRKAQDTACTVFGTVLGPEANNAHRNHFHVDLATRRNGSYCR
jgi:hypothetical protein